MKIVGVLLAILIWVSIARGIEASPVANNPIFDGGKLILNEPSTITVTAWLGTASCRVGQVNLVQPDLKLLKSSKENETAKNTKTQSGAPKRQADTIIYNYAIGKPSVEIGQYLAGTEFVFEIQTGSFCKSSHLSTEKLYTRLKHNGGNSWTLSMEDWKDNDIDDVHIEITVHPSDGIIGTQVFADEPVYKLPWPTGISQKVTVLPGVGEHRQTRSYDISMKIGNKIVASEMGLVLWIEDSFGPGGPINCPENLADSVKNYWRPRANVVVIQTEAGVNLTYVHLQQGSVQLSGIKVGDTVKQGQWIGNAGNSGFVCSGSGNGSHLHLEWQHNCYDLDQAKKRRLLKGSRVGEPTFTWSCPNFPADSLYSFTLAGKILQIKKTPSEQTSDNSVN